MPNTTKVSARERILDAAYELFTRRGLRDVSVDEIISASGVAIATFYRHFRSKDDLAIAFLSRREQLWTVDGVVKEAQRRSPEPVGQLLAIFEVFAEWFGREDFEGDSFVSVLLEMGAEHPLGKASIVHLTNVRDSLAMLASEAGIADSQAFAHSYQILMKGSIITATMGDTLAADRARPLAKWLIEQHLPEGAGRS